MATEDSHFVETPGQYNRWTKGRLNTLHLRELRVVEADQRAPQWPLYEDGPPQGWAQPGGWALREGPLRGEQPWAWVEEMSRKERKRKKKENGLYHTVPRDFHDKVTDNTFDDPSENDWELDSYVPERTWKMWTD